MRAGVAKVGHLCIPGRGGWKSPQELSDQTGIQSHRLLERLCGAVQGSLSAAVGNILARPRLEEPPDFPELSAGLEIGDWRESGELLLTCVSPGLGELSRVKGKALYEACVKVRNIRSLREVRAHQWQEVFGEDSGGRFRWRVFYKPPTQKRTGDLQWRIVHGALATNQFLARLDPGVGEGCFYCGECETVVHLFSTCHRISSVCLLLRGVSEKLGFTFSVELFVLGPRYTHKGREKCVLLNFVFGLAKLAIWLTRRNSIRGNGSTDPVQMLRGMVAARVRAEYAFFCLGADEEGFKRVWCLGGVLCTVGPQGLNVTL